MVTYYLNLYTLSGVDRPPIGTYIFVSLAHGFGYNRQTQPIALTNATMANLDATSGDNGPIANVKKLIITPAIEAPPK